jgi:hypothetical protein
MEGCFVLVLQECDVCLTFRGGECQRGILSFFSGYSAKSPLHRKANSSLGKTENDETAQFKPFQDA